MAKHLLVLLMISVMVLSIAGCGEEQQNRSVVTVASLNENVPFLADVYSENDLADPLDDAIVEDYIEVLFQNKPYNNLVITEPFQPHGDYIVDQYTITWTRTDGGSGVPPDYFGGTSIRVPSGGFGGGNIVLVPFSVKLMPFMVALQGTGTELLMVATITFSGHEAGTDRRSTFAGSISVGFGDVIIVE